MSKREEIEAFVNEFRALSAGELALRRADAGENALISNLVDQELLHREQIAQHKLDVQLIADQVRWMKFSAIFGAVATIVGAVAGALLTLWLK